MARWGLFVKYLLKSTPVVVAGGYLCDAFKEYSINARLVPYHFNRQQFKRRSPFKWNRRFVWARAFYDIYGPYTALAASRLALQARPDIEFHFFGDGPALKKMIRLFRHPNIRFRGYVPRQAFLEELEYFSCLINTSLYDNFPLSLAEAAFYQMLVISTDLASIKSIYDSSECLFFEKGDYKALARHILDVTEDPYRFDAHRINISKKAEGFSWEKVRGEWLDLIYGTVRGRRHGET